MSDIPYGYCHCGCGQKTTISNHTSTRHCRVKGEPTLYLAGHGKRVPVVDYAIDTKTGCWLWLRHIDEYGYARLYNSENPSTLAYQIYYERSRGPLADGERLKHACGNRHCVNPDHLVTHTRLDDFWQLVDKNSPNGCWNWTGILSAYGYGVFWFQGKMRRSHMISYTLLVGPIPDGLCALHRCDNRRCVNPAHIFIGTKSDNSRDMIEKKRSLTGERNHKAKLTTEQVQEIRLLYANGGISQNALARQFGVCQTHISKIVQHKGWRHI